MDGPVNKHALPQGELYNKNFDLYYVQKQSILVQFSYFLTPWQIKLILYFHHKWEKLLTAIAYERKILEVQYQ
jgi:hypothetical protein